MKKPRVWAICEYSVDDENGNPVCQCHDNGMAPVDLYRVAAGVWMEGQPCDNPECENGLSYIYRPDGEPWPCPACEGWGVVFPQARFNVWPGEWRKVLVVRLEGDTDA